MEHHIAQSSPISPRQKGMDGSRQVRLYGVYDAFAGARSLISRRLCALITAIGIAVLTISSSAWATHTPIPDPVNVGMFLDVDDVTSNEIAEGAVHTEEIGDGEVGNADLGPDAVTSDKILDGTITGHTDPATPGDPAILGDIAPNSIQEEDIAPDAVTNSELAPNAVEEENIGVQVVCGSGDLNADCDGSGNPKTHIKPGTIGTADIADGGVVGDAGPGTSDIAPGSIGSADIADGSINGGTDPTIPSDIAPGTIGSVDLATGAVGNDELAEVSSAGDDGAVNTNNINTDAVNSRTIARGAICGSGDDAADCQGSGGASEKAHIRAGTIGGADLAADTVTTDKLAEYDTTTGTGGAVSNNNINDGVVDSRTIGDGEVTSADLEVVDPSGNGGAVDTGNIVNDAVTTEKLAEYDTTTGMGGAVSNNNINTNVIDSRTIATDTIRHEDIADNAVRTEEIANGAVETEDLANNAVDSRTLGTGVVCGSENNGDCDEAGTGPRTHIRAQSIGTNDLKQVDTEGQQVGRNGAVNENNINDNAVTGRKIRDGSITSTKIGNRQVMEDHIANRQVIGRHIDDGAISRRHLGPDIENIFRRIEGDIDRLDEGIAMSHAISMIKVPEGKEFGISFAGGFYQDKQAAAIGVGFRPSDGLLLSAGASYGFDSEEIGGAVSINFGF